MYIGGYNGINYDQAATSFVSYGVFLQVEWADIAAGTAAASRGMLCAWDFVDNTAQTGILRETRGLRVKVHPTLADATNNPNRPAGVLLTDVAAIAARTDGALTRQPMITIMAYGPADFLLADTDADGNLVAGSILIPSPDTAGKFNGPASQVAPTEIEKGNAVGFSYQTVAVDTVATIKGFVSCLAMT